MRACLHCGRWLNYIVHGWDAEYCSQECEESGPSEPNVELPESELARMKMDIRRLTNENKRLNNIVKGRARRIGEWQKNKGQGGCCELKAEIKKSGCALCGYDKCNSALEFHHLKTKGAAISAMSLVDQLICEIETHPVVLLCANCHREVHAGSIDTDCLANRAINITDFLTTGQKIEVFRK